MQQCYSIGLQVYMRIHVKHAVSEVYLHNFLFSQHDKNVLTQNSYFVSVYSRSLF